MSNEAAASSPKAPVSGRRSRRRRYRRVAVVIAVLVIVILGVGELVARFGFGLGDPPLFRTDPDFEYITKPGRYWRMGHWMSYNQYSMRSPEFPARSTNPQELRVMVLGDSVVTGTSPIGDDQVMTAVLQRLLKAQLNRPVLVGNIACGSWGPGNLLAYTRRYGFFDANVVVVLLSSHDATDVPTFQPVVDTDPNFPGHKPLCALSEAVFRYLPRYLPKFGNTAATGPANANPTSQPEADADAVPDFRKLLQAAGQDHRRVLFMQHLDQEELGHGAWTGHQRMAEAAKAEGVAPIDLLPLEQQDHRAGGTMYLDNIHLSPAGHEKVAQLMAELVAALPVTQPAEAPSMLPTP